LHSVHELRNGGDRFDSISFRQARSRYDAPCPQDLYKTMTNVDPGREGRREQKKRETMQRIAMTGLLLFVRKGFDQTTLDEIAAEAGIARRTFFHYFKSKEDVLLAYMDGGGFANMLRAALLAEPTDQTPLSAIYESLQKTLGVQQTDVATEVDRLLHSTDALRARMQAGAVETERIVFETLCERWPDADKVSLRMAAMAGIGAMRVAKEAWRQDGRKTPLADYLRESFGALEGLR